MKSFPVERGGGWNATLHADFERAFSPVQAAVETGALPGAVLGIVDLDHGRMTGGIGSAALIPAPRRMRLETWFDLASLTKVLFTTPRILALHLSGRLDLDAPLTSVVPDLRQQVPDAWERAVTFRQCLGHQTGFPAVFPLYTYGSDPHLLRHFVLQHDWPEGPPVYSDLNYILLGIALERLENRLIREQDPGPGFAFAAPPELAAATELCPWRGRVLCGEVHDENCAALAGAGHAGLFGTVTAVLDQAESWLREADTPLVRLMRAPVSATRTLGWERPHPGWSGGDRAGSETLGHTGFTGTGLWLDFAQRRAWCLLTNRIHPARRNDSIFALRRQVGDAMSAAA
jgi:CubicO group peptidase (beta-lactamase class C family)